MSHISVLMGKKSEKSKMVTWGPFGDLSQNDPILIICKYYTVYYTYYINYM